MGLTKRSSSIMAVSLYSLVLVGVISATAYGGHYRFHGGHHSKLPKPVMKTAPTMSIAEIATADSRFSTLLAAVKAAGLAETLSGAGSFTVFAPTNDAFAMVPKETLDFLLANPDDLKAVLLRHVLPTKVPSSNINNGRSSVVTVGGESITVNRANGKISVTSSAGEANVIIPDVEATNGIIHAVDTVF